MTNNLKARKFTKEMTDKAIPRIQTKEEAKWSENYEEISGLKLDRHRKRWLSEVPGSLSPDSVVIGAIQAMENKGYDVKEAEDLIDETDKAFKNGDNVNFLKNKAKIYKALNMAPKVNGHKYFSYNYYDSFQDYLKEVNFHEYRTCNFEKNSLFERIHAGWLGQIAGAALGTQLEGYTYENINKKFGNVEYYVRNVSTQNDDILYELAFLEAVNKYGKEVDSEKIALEWVSKIQYARSAEEAALRNLQMGIFPPESAKVSNFWNEWIGAQMRGSVCGMVVPGNPRKAAELAWMDGRISHINNGIIGEVFNSILIANSFIYNNVRDALDATIKLLPKKSQYYSVIDFAYSTCKKSKNWQEALKACQEEYKRYYWIHTYPNAAIEIISLFFAGNSFDKCMNIVSMCGLDVDCNAGQIGTIYGTMFGYKGIDKKWILPFNDKFQSLYIGFENTTITNIANHTMTAIAALK